jgi:hypothetical protein
MPTNQHCRNLRGGRYCALAGPYSGERIRLGHWAVAARRQGQTAARNMLEAHEAFDAEPFFWSQHYDVRIKLCRTRREVGSNCDRREHRSAGLPAEMQKQRPRACGRLDLSRPCSLQADFDMERNLMR